MTTVKIISDPYIRNVDFETIDNTTGEYERVSYQNNPGSKLVTEEIQKNFFPYKVKDILKILCEEYRSGDEILHIIFEGTADEFLELKEASKGLDYINLHRSGIEIKNARDILPKIVDIFSRIQPIVEKNISSEEARNEINQNIAKFCDASNDVVPICVLGNYSSGKSTFINALIGLEILPNGDMPVTAKIYKIGQLKKSAHAVIDFEYNGDAVRVTIAGQENLVSCKNESEFVSNLNRVLQDISTLSLEKKVNQCLEVINRQREGISDLINILIPFADGPLKNTKNSFVIFDTPGSNTATYKDHFSILEGAMKNLSNGIPIYVAEYHSLDSCDNELLYEKIKKISQIDSRFTMVVVNKADTANIKEKVFDTYMENMLLEQAVPRNLYSGGIYFVSSIMGLGSKTGGAFIDEYAEELYEMNVEKYKDSSSKWYKVLYKYNIMPEQIKQRIIEDSEASDNVLFANSGLLAIEHEIVNFAEKYSAYDKCKQSDKYIDKITDATQAEIEQKRDERELTKKELGEQLEEDKQALMAAVEQKSKDLLTAYCRVYDGDMKWCFAGARFSFSEDEVKKIENDIRKEKHRKNNLDEKSEKVRKSKAAVRDDLFKIRKQGIAETFRNVTEDLRFEREIIQKRNEARMNSDRETADELLQVMTKDYEERVAKAIKSIDTSSRSLWERKAEETKVVLLKIVDHSPTIDDDKKKELSNIIISYKSVTFEDEHEFRKIEYEKKLRLFGKVFYFNKINTKKLSEAYNRDYANAINGKYQQLKNSHRDSFEVWREQLVNEIQCNIVNYSPKLSAKAKQIEAETRAIVELEKTKRTLSDYSEQINALMDWKPVAGENENGNQKHREESGDKGC